MNNLYWKIVNILPSHIRQLFNPGRIQKFILKRSLYRSALFIPIGFFMFGAFMEDIFLSMLLYVVAVVLVVYYYNNVISRIESRWGRLEYVFVILFTFSVVYYLLVMRH